MEVNKYKLKDIKKMINVIDVYNIDNNIEFDYLRIISMTNKRIENKSKNILFFPITLGDDYVKEGWVTRRTDLLTPINEIIGKFPDYTFVVQEDMVDKVTNKDAKLIVVDNVMKAIDDMYNYIISHNKFKTIAITGSAGKTTCVGLIEKVVSTKYKTLRIYSDRITPIVLKAHIINFLNKTYDLVALEMGIYYKHHVKALADLINPDIAAVINIGDAHLNSGGLNSIDDICINKSKIFEHAKIGYINYDNPYLANLSLNNNKLYYKNKYICDTKMKELRRISPSNSDLKNNILYINNNKIKINILTSLSIHNSLLAYNIGKDLNIDDKDIIDAINKFKVVEHRLQRVKIFGKEVIFDGDSSFKERIHQLSLHLYDKAYLVLRCYGSDYYIDDFKGIKEYFNNFNKVYLFKDINYIDDLKNGNNVVIVDNNDFLKDLDGEVFYHYNDYFYKFDKVDEDNLR